MSEIEKSIVLGVLTIAIWLVASTVLNNKGDKSISRDDTSIGQITFIETLTIDYEGDTN